MQKALGRRACVQRHGLLACLDGTVFHPSHGTTAKKLRDNRKSLFRCDVLYNPFGVDPARRRPISDAHFSGERPEGAAGKKSRLSTDEKIRIVLQTLNPQASMVEICREHNLVSRTVYVWKEKFLAGGRSSLDGPDASKQVKRRKEEVASLKRIIGEYAVANDVLKKALEAN